MIEVSKSDGSSSKKSTVNLVDYLKGSNARYDTNLRPIASKLYAESNILKAEGKILKAESRILKAESDLVRVDFSLHKKDWSYFLSTRKSLEMEAYEEKIRGKISQAKGKLMEAGGKLWDIDVASFQIPRIYISGVFSDDNNTNPITYSHLVRLMIKVKNDIDGSKAYYIKQNIRSIPYSFSYFMDMSDSYINILVRVDSDYSNHQIAQQLAATYYEKIIGVNLERNKMINTDSCQYCYDPYLFINPDCIPFHVILEGKSDGTQDEDVTLKGDQ